MSENGGLSESTSPESDVFWAYSFFSFPFSLNKIPLAGFSYRKKMCVYINTGFVFLFIFTMCRHRRG